MRQVLSAVDLPCLTSMNQSSWVRKSEGYILWIFREHSLVGYKDLTDQTCSEAVPGLSYYYHTN